MDVVKSSFSRVFLIEHRAGPANAPQYMGNKWRAGALSWDQGSVTPIYIPSNTEYDSFKRVGKTAGEPGNPELTLNSRYLMDLSDLLRIVKNGCEHDLQIHFGKCRDPRDFNDGWEKIGILEAARGTRYSTDDLGAIEPSQRAAVMEEAPFSGDDWFEVKRLTFTTRAGTIITQEIVDVEFCDSRSCGLCGLPSDGCQVVLALTVTSGASPGMPARVVFTEDGGGAWSSDLIDTLAPSEDPDAFACVGINLVVISNASCSLHYAPIADVLDVAAVWTEVATGFVCAAGAPNAMHSLGPSYSWIVGNGGYIYFTEDPTSGVEVQDAGVATTENLLAVHFLDELNGVAVGINNAVVLTRDGGQTWEALTGPAVGIQLNTIWMRSEDEWFIGSQGGILYYTRDGGVSWTTKGFPGSGSGIVREVKFVNNTVGYMSHDTAAGVARVLRTISGGHSWYVLPEGSATMPTALQFNAIGVCTDPNVVYAGGVIAAVGDGILVRGA